MTAPAQTDPQQGLAVRLFDWAYRPKGTVPDYVSCQVAWQELAAGQGTLVIDEADPKSQLILSVHMRPLMVVVDVAGQRWSGRVSSGNLHRDGGPPGSGVVTANLVHDWVWLLYMLASQNGADPTLTGMPVNDTQTGPAATVAAYFINAAATRLAVPVLAVPPADDQSAEITVSARMTPLSDLLTGPLAAAGVSLPASMWLPGDLPPAPGVTLTRPTVVFTPQLRPDKPWLRWKDTGSLPTVDLTVTSATAYRAMLGLDGQDAARVYDSYVDVDLQAQVGDYGLPEVYRDETSVALGLASQASGSADLADNRPTVAAAVEVVDGRPFRFGEHYVCGDRGRASVAGVDLVEQISKVTVADDRANGLTFTPVLGSARATASSDEQLALAMASIAQNVRAVQAGR